MTFDEIKDEWDQRRSDIFTEQIEYEQRIIDGAEKLKKSRMGMGNIVLEKARRDIFDRADGLKRNHERLDLRNRNTKKYIKPISERFLEA